MKSIYWFFRSVKVQNYDMADGKVSIRSRVSEAIFHLICPSGRREKLCAGLFI